MAHLHDLRDQDTHFTIDPDTMEIINPNSKKNKLMLGDHNAEIFTFDIPRILEGHDMSLCDRIRIHYINVSSDKAYQSKDIFDAVNVSVEELDGVEYLTFTWKISGNATKYAGSLNFRVNFRCFDEDKETVVYSKWTDVFKGIAVSDGFDNTEAVTEMISDVLEKWKQELIESGSNVSDEKIGTAVSNYLTAHPIEENDPTVPDWAKQTDKPTYTADEVGAISQNDLQAATDTALAQAKASGEFNGSPGAPGADGKSAYQYAQDAGYTGTESDFSTRLATEIPTTLPNPQKLTFSGAVSAEYDGSGAVTVEIPENSGESMVRIEKNADDTTVEIQPNTLYIFPEMLSLTYTLAAAVDGVASEYHFVFQSGSTATELVHPENVKIGSFAVESGYIYEISIMENLLCSQNWKI